MRIAGKVAMATLSVLVVFFGAGGSLLVGLAFRSSLSREIDVAQEELQMLRLSVKDRLLTKIRRGGRPG